MSDIAPELLEQVRRTFQTKRANDKTLGSLYWAIQDGRADYETVNRYAIRLGELLAESMKLKISASDLPDGRFYQELAEELIAPLLTDNYELISTAAVTAQNAMNRAAGIGLKAVKPTINRNRVQGLVDKVSSYETYEKAAWVLDEPVVNFSQSVVDDAIRENVAAQAGAGLRPTVTRIAESGCCEWCSDLAGEYAYPVDREVYRRHERCRCIVLFDPGKGKVQNVHSKVLYAEAEREARIQNLEQELSELEQSISDYVDISLIGVQVTSGKYGTGTVVSQDINRVTVRFPDIERSFILDEKYAARPRFENDDEIVSVFTKYGRVQERIKSIQKEIKLLNA